MSVETSIDARILQTTSRGTAVISCTAGVYDGGHGSAVKTETTPVSSSIRMVMEARCLYLCLQMDNQLLVLAIVTARD